jgi:23S rRNA pseudouridine1911/1915/1917 synthase
VATSRPAGIDPDFIEIELVVAREYAGWRADRYVARRIPRLSRTRVQRILKELAFDESGQRIKPNRSLREGERITIFKPPPEEPDVVREFGVVYEDRWLLGVDKPAGLPVHPTARYFRNTLTSLLAERFGENRPVLTHRLDSETSGALLCAKDLPTERAFKKMFADRKVTKTYLAVARGLLEPGVGRIEASIGSDPGSPIRVKMGCDVIGGLPALTEYQVLRDLGDRCLVELHPRTGRQHQLRVHLAHVGHPIVGDKMYGPDETLFLDYIDDGPTPEIIERAGFRRQALHAARLDFDHPHTGEPTRIESPLPDDICSLLEQER